MATVNLLDLALVSNPDTDNVAVALKDIAKGIIVPLANGDSLKVRENILKSHRFATRKIGKGDYLMQYGQPFGRSMGIEAGEAVSPKNVENVLPKIDTNSHVDPEKTLYDSELTEKKFLGYKRATGKVGTRNYYLVVPTSMCVSETALQVSQLLDSTSEYCNIDGIVAIPNTEGCGCASTGQIERFLRVLKGYITHPNVGGCLIIDLGCEQTNYQVVREYLDNGVNGIPVDWLTVQESGGTRMTIEEGKKLIEGVLSEVNKIERTPVSISNLVLGTECGASDSFSGITANPLIGRVADMIVRGKGKAILSEIPEMIGTLGAFLPRFRSMEVLDKFKNVQKWYEELAQKLGLTLEDNLVDKNIEGGLINNVLKSLGAVIKGGSTAIEDVVEYGESLTKDGLTIMQGPGGDPESVTGMVASGANIVCFSTGFGATSGNAICPVIKISSNDEVFDKLPEDIDFNAGAIVSEKADVGHLSDELLQKVIDVASGEKTWSEKWKQRQFQVWTAGKLPL